MSNYDSNLKAWGATGSAYPDGYNYLAGEQPVDEWDNFLTANTIEDLFHLINLTDSRLETGSGNTHPSSPEPGEVSHRTDGVIEKEEEIFFYDSMESVWHRFMKADGDKMTGRLDTGGYQIEDSSGKIALADETQIQGAKLSTEWMSKQEGGTVDAGSLVPVGTFGLDDGETLEVSQAMLMKDGISTACVSGLDLVLTDGSSSLQTVLAGDGATIYDDEIAGWSYTNTTGAHQTIAIALDNGHFNAGYGSRVSAYGGFVARVN